MTTIRRRRRKVELDEERGEALEELEVLLVGEVLVEVLLLSDKLLLLSTRMRMRMKMTVSLSRSSSKTMRRLII